MTNPPGVAREEPERGMDTSHRLVSIAIIGLLIVIVILLLFIISVVSGPAVSGAGNSPGGGAVAGGAAPVPAAMEMPVAEITTKSAICQVTDLLTISGSVENNAGHLLSVAIAGTAYDSNGVELGTGYDTVLIAPQGTSPFSLSIIDGCQIGDTGTYDVRIADISWRKSD